MYRRHAFTLIELLVALAITGLVAAVGALSLRGLENPLASGAGQLEGFLKQARSKAMSTTSAYRVRADAAGKLVAEYANTCAATSWTADARLVLALPKGVRVAATSPAWPVCFTSRGLADKNLVVTLADARGRTRRVEVMLGGGVRPL